MCDVVLTCYCSGYEIKKDVMIGESVTYGEQEKSCSVSVGTRGEKGRLEDKDVGLHGNVLHKRILK